MTTDLLILPDPATDRLVVQRSRRRVIVGARGTGDVHLRVTDQQGDRAARGVLVARSLLLTSRSVAASPRDARRVLVAIEPTRTLGRATPSRPVALDSDAAFVTSPALGWTLVGIHGVGLGITPVSRLEGLHVETGRGWRWLTGEQVAADLEARLRVLGADGERVAQELGL